MKRRWARRILLGLGALVLLLWGLQRIAWPVLEVRHASMWPALEGGRDRVVVQRGSGRPERFDLVVLREDDDRLVVKRAIAFGGEHLDIRAGDLFVGRSRAELTRLERPPELLRQHWLPVFPERGFLRSESGPAVPDLPATWESGPTGEARAWLLLRGSRDVHDHHLGSRDGWLAGDAVVPDLAIEWEIRSIEATAVFTLRHLLSEPFAERWVRLGAGSLVLGQGDARSRRNVGIARWDAIETPLRLRMETRDGEFLLRRAVRGGAWETLYAAPRDTAAASRASRVSLEIRGGSVALGSLAVQRDVHYRWAVPPEMRSPGPYHVDEGVFLLGDNPPVSRDSRAFGPLPFARIWGRARAVVWPRSRARFLP